MQACRTDLAGLVCLLALLSCRVCGLEVRLETSRLLGQSSRLLGLRRAQALCEAFQLALHSGQTRVREAPPNQAPCTCQAVGGHQKCGNQSRRSPYPTLNSPFPAIPSVVARCLQPPPAPLAWMPARRLPPCLSPAETAARPGPELAPWQARPVAGGATPFGG